MDTLGAQGGEMNPLMALAFVVLPVVLLFERGSRNYKIAWVLALC